MDTDRKTNDTETAGVIARPPFLFLGALLLGLVWDRLLPLPFPVPGTDLAHWIGGGTLILIGLALAVAGIRNFSRVGTPVEGYKPTRALATAGIHGWSRNPIYLGMFLIYGGIGLAAQNLWMLMITVPLAIIIRYGVVAREEAYLERGRLGSPRRRLGDQPGPELERRFGADYRDYKSRVRRWL